MASPDEYRAKWGLPADYPMVAPNYAEQRRSLAVKIGLGRKPGAEIILVGEMGGQLICLPVSLKGRDDRSARRLPCPDALISKRFVPKRACA